MSPGPLRSDATRAAHLRALLRGREVAYAVVGGGAAALALTAMAGASPAVVLLSPVVVAALVVAVAAVAAWRRAADEFFRSFAASIGFVLHGPAEEIPAFTPLLAAGTERETTRIMSGRLDGHATRIGHHSWRSGTDSDRLGVAGPSRRFTIAVVDLEPEGVPWCSGIYLHPRRRLGCFLAEDWLPRGLDTLETESSVVRGRYVLRAERDVDPLRVRELLSPSLLDRLARDPRRPGFEYRAGVLVVFEDGHAADAGSYVALLDATRAIAARIIAEAEEARVVGGVASAPPPLGGSNTRRHS